MTNTSIPPDKNTPLKIDFKNSNIRNFKSLALVD
jgi:hypothetical protein